MTETYSTTIPNITDYEGDNVKLQIIFKKIPFLNHTNKYYCIAEAFDSKGRYFMGKLTKDFKYYENKLKEAKLNNIRYEYFNENGEIYLETNEFGYGDSTLYEDKDNKFHLRTINDQIEEKEKELEDLKNKRRYISKFYNEFNLY